MSFRLATLALVLCVVVYGQGNPQSTRPFARTSRADRGAGMPPTGWRYSPPDCSATSQTPPEAAVVSPQDFVELERSYCFGGCPAYRVRLYRTADIEWRSRHRTRVDGDVARATADTSETEVLFNRIYAQEIWSACDAYPLRSEDGPTYHLRVNLGGQRKAIEFGSQSGVPWLIEFARDLDGVVEAHRWLQPDPAAAGNLIYIASGVANRNATPLIEAAAAGDLEEIAELIAAGASVDEQDANGWTALMYAAANYQLKTITALLAAGADPNHANLAGWTPLMISAYGSGYEALLPVTRNINHQSEAGLSALMLMAGRANVKMVRSALSLGAEPALVDATRRTAWDYLMQSYCRPLLEHRAMAGLEPSTQVKEQCHELDRLLKPPVR